MNTPEIIDLPARDVLAVDGVGAPDAPAFRRAIVALARAVGAADAPFEGTYAQDGDPMRFDLDAPGGWHWTLQVPAPAAATEVVEPVRRRRQEARTVAQLLHRGPYEDEGPSLEALYAFVAQRGFTPMGAHTEVYLTDPSRTPRADLRTLLRVPVR